MIGCVLARAFMDVTAQTYWGGLITADRVTISWEWSSFSRTTPLILPDTERIEVCEFFGGSRFSLVH